MFAQILDPATYLILTNAGVQSCPGPGGLTLNRHALIPARLKLKLRQTLVPLRQRRQKKRWEDFFHYPAQK